MAAMRIITLLLMCCLAFLANAYPNNFDKPQLPAKKPAPEDLYKPSPYNKLPKPMPYTALAVEGVVLCQDCKGVGSKSLSYATPLPGAKVKLACQTGSRYKTFFSAISRTDYNGFFNVRVPSFNFKTFTPLKNCVVFLVSSPYASCSTPTDINYGQSGALLRHEKSYRVYQARYSVAPLVFSPLPCKRPMAYYNKKPTLSAPPIPVDLPPPAPVADTLAPAPSEY